ncbi:hypothetical protein [Paraclostridium sordellii]|uniref:hypothetical protein n=1 Tax=Paraclostridium sordellii TaxID=1505 RepID=UPI000E54B706|nr:hypothetical protein [Paeniclostridium sordellii]RGX09359.1 hypothetical protein DWV40_07630 [Paeniclostridium sordellii]
MFYFDENIFLILGMLTVISTIPLLIKFFFGIKGLIVTLVFVLAILGLWSFLEKRQDKKDFLLDLKGKILDNDTTYESLKWIVNYYISKNMYPYIRKEICLDLKNIFDLLDKGIKLDSIYQISKCKKYSVIDIDLFRDNLINRLKYREVKGVDVCNEIKSAYINPNLDKDHILKLDRWLVKQILDTNCKKINYDDLRSLKEIIQEK